MSGQFNILFTFSIFLTVAVNHLQNYYDQLAMMAAVTGACDVVQKLKRSDNVYRNGENNFEYITANAPLACNSEIYSHESKFTAVRRVSRILQLKTRSGLFNLNQPDSLLINLRQDSFERHTNWKIREAAMKLAIAFGGRVEDLPGQRFKGLQQFPPIQKSSGMTV